MKTKKWVTYLGALLSLSSSAMADSISLASLNPSGAAQLCAAGEAPAACFERVAVYANTIMGVAWFSGGAAVSGFRDYEDELGRTGGQVNDSARVSLASACASTGRLSTFIWLTADMVTQAANQIPAVAVQKTAAMEMVQVYSQLASTMDRVDEACYGIFEGNEENPPAAASQAIVSRARRQFHQMEVLAAEINRRVITLTSATSATASPVSESVTPARLN